MRVSVEEVENAEFSVLVIKDETRQGVYLTCEKLAEIGVFVDGEQRITIGHSFVPRTIWTKTTKLCDKLSKEAFGSSQNIDEEQYMRETNADFKWRIEEVIFDGLNAHKDWETKDVKGILDIIYGALNRANHRKIHDSYLYSVSREREECEILGFLPQVIQTAQTEIISKKAQDFGILKSRR